jgi:hypothetical protein
MVKFNLNLTTKFFKMKCDINIAINSLKGDDFIPPTGMRD